MAANLSRFWAVDVLGLRMLPALFIRQEVKQMPKMTLTTEESSMTGPYNPDKILNLTEREEELRAHVFCREKVMEEIEAATPLRVRFAFDLIEAGGTVTALSPEEMEAIVLRALNGDFDEQIDWEVKAK